MIPIKSTDSAGWAERVKRHAQAELDEERFREQVEIEKTQLRAKRWWHILFPWRITFIRRD